MVHSDAWLYLDTQRMRVWWAFDSVICNSTSVQCRNEQNVITCLQLVLVFTFEFPISIVDEDENAGPSSSSINMSFCYIEEIELNAHRSVLHEEFLSRIFD